MSKLAVWTCCAVFASLVMVTLSYPGSIESQDQVEPLQYSLTSNNLNSNSEVGSQGSFPIYNPALLASNENEATRDKRDLLKKGHKGKGGGGGQPIIIINKYGGGGGHKGGGYGGGHKGGGYGAYGGGGGGQGWGRK